MNAFDTQPRSDGDLRPTLLIADDDAIVRSALHSQLELDFRVVAVATNATEAVEHAAEHQPDAVLLDVEMPEGGAREAVPRIVARSPGTCIVILSSDESHSNVIELLSAGAIAYIRKGVPASQIRQTLTDALQAKADQPPL